MKILIVYYSMTGNTEMVAKSMQDALVGQDVTLTRVEDLDPSGFKGYDLVLLGSGIYAGRFHKTIKKFLKETTKLPPKFALFYTHATQDAETYQPFPRNIRKLIEKGESSICGEFECLGENKNIPEEQVQARLQGLSTEQRKKAEADIAILKGHPNVEDLQKAKNFAKSLL